VVGNTSASGGPLAPLASPAPLEGEDLNNFLQQIVVSCTGLDGTMVRPRWQVEPPNLPRAGTAWCALGIQLRTADTFAYVKHDGAGLGSALLQRHEELEILSSFYDTGTNGQADMYAALLRDGLAIGQNREPLFLAGMGLKSVGDLTAVPSLLKLLWLYRVDVPFVIRRVVERTYAILNIASAGLTLEADGSTLFVRNINVIPEP
jgi:hypothetical protein